MIIVLGSVTALPEKLEEALAASREHVARSLREPGCLAHAVHRDGQNPNRLVFVEKWSDKAALLEHIRLPESRAFGKLLAGLAAEPPAMEVFEAGAASLR